MTRADPTFGFILSSITQPKKSRTPTWIHPHHLQLKQITTAIFLPFVIIVTCADPKWLRMPLNQPQSQPHRRHPNPNPPLVPSQDNPPPPNLLAALRLVLPSPSPPPSSPPLFLQPAASLLVLVLACILLALATASTHWPTQTLYPAILPSPASISPFQSKPIFTISQKSALPPIIS